VLSSALAHQSAVNYLVTRGAVQIDLAAALIANDQAEDALSHFDEVIQRARQGSECVYLAEAWRLKALALARRSHEDFEGREAALGWALSAARAQGALAWEVRASLDQARLRIDAGRAVEAGEDLERSVAAFAAETETTDLRAARDLLATLRPGARTDV
jgi:predicted ATPase